MNRQEERNARARAVLDRIAEHVDVLDELVYVESAISATGTKFYGELTEQMIKMAKRGSSPS